MPENERCRRLATVLATDFLGKPQEEQEFWSGILLGQVGSWSDGQVAWCFSQMELLVNGLDDRERRETHDAIDRALSRNQFPENIV